MLSEVNRLNLSPEVLAFDKENNKLVGLGMGMSDIIFGNSPKHDRFSHACDAMRCLAEGYKDMYEHTDSEDDAIAKQKEEDFF